MPSGRKRTHEEFIKLMQDVHANIQVLGTYKTAKTKIKVRCKICGHEWEAWPSDLLRGHGCPICAMKNKTKTHEKFIQELEQINTDIEVLGTYINGKTKIKVKCKLDGHIWKAQPCQLLLGSGCPKCNIIKQTKTHEKFIQELYERNIHAKDIEVLGTYKSAHTKIKCKCKIHGYEWEVRPSELLQGSGCPICGTEISAQKNTKTHEQFIQELYKINENIQVLSTYKGALTPIKCKCKIDEYEWEAQPSNLLNGTGCPKCSITKQTKTHEQFIKELEQINPNIEILGTYVTRKTKIKCKCKVCGYEWEATPDSLLSGHGCHKCANLVARTQEEFLQELKQINQNIEVLGTYVTNKTNIKVRCKICGHIWKAKPYNLLQGTGCPKCAMKKVGEQHRKTHEQFIKQVKQINPYIEVLGTYINQLTKIKCRCKLDGYEWEVFPSSLLQGSGCPKCAGTIKKTHEQFIKELQQINQDIEVLGTYVNSQTKIKCRCKIDGYEWEGIPNNLLLGSGCPKCSITKGEKRVAQYLDNLGIDYIYNTGYFNDLVGTGGGLMRPDFIIPALKIWIEYDGIQHFEPVNFTSKMSEEQMQEKFEYTQQNDQIKNQYAKDNNWTLIRIPYWDYDNIEQILDAVLKQKEAI